MWDITIHPLKEPDDPVGTTGQLVRLALIPNVTARPNLPYIVRFGPYCPHGFVCGDASPLLSLTPQNAYDKLTTSTTNKARNQLLTRRYGILQSTPLMEPDDPVGTTRQPMRSALIPNVTARPNLPYIVRFGPYRHHDFVPSDTSLLLSLAPKNMYDKLATSTTNKASNQLFISRCGILQFTPFKEPDDPVGPIGQPMRSTLIPNVTARPNLPYIVHFGPYCPHGFIYLLAYIISIYLIICIHKLSDLQLNFLNYRNTLKKTYIYNQQQSTGQITNCV
jgi:hypothetical protein